MSLLDKLRAGESALTGLDGASPAIVDQALSTLHKTYSIDGQPFMNNLPSPTQLKATINEDDKYLNNLPE